MSATKSSTPRLEKIPKHPGLYYILDPQGKRTGKLLVRYRDERGAVKDRRFPNLTEAVRFKGRVMSGQKRADSRIPFSHYAPDWVKRYSGRTKHGVSDETRESYRYAIEELAVKFFKRTPMERIDTPMLGDFVTYLNEKGLAANTVRRYFAAVRALLATAQGEGLIAVNPAFGFRVIAHGQSMRAKANHPKVLTVEQTIKLLEKMPPRHAELALLYSTTGARLSEPMPLTWGGLGQDPDGRPTITFPRSKTEAGLQPIPIVPELSQALMRRRAEQQAKGGGGQDDLVFPGQHGQQMSGRTWRRTVFNPAAKRAGVEWATPHMLRHGVATLMAERGYTAADIARMLRHADGGRLAQKTYMHPAAPDIAVLSEFALRREAG